MSSKQRTAAERRLDKVRSAFSAEDLVRVCSQTDFRDYAPRVDLDALPPGSPWGWHGRPSERFFYYRDRGAPVLAVAHLDHVQSDPTCRVVKTGDGPLALSGALDDRLGAYVILEMLPKLGVAVDWLLTTDEEMAASTAREFYVDHKQYNWIIEFDRGGTDVVSYQYDSPGLRELVKAAGARMGEGSYSDIADLDQLGCVGLNWGVGYYDYHSKRSHAWLNDTFDMVSRFLRFYAANAGTFLPYEEDDCAGWPADRCKICNGKLEEDSGWCPQCDFGEPPEHRYGGFYIGGLRSYEDHDLPDDEVTAEAAKEWAEQVAHYNAERAARATEW